MRLRENAVYIRLATTHDLHDDGSCATIVRDVEGALGHRFATWRDLAAVRAPAIDFDIVRAEEIDALSGGGLFRRLRFRLESQSGDSLEWNAGTHPYSGVYVTQIDARLRYDSLEDDASARLDTLARRWIAITRPLWAHVHDVDDNAIQNASSETMLRLGFGVDPATLGDDRPGREVSRGEFRYAVNWRTFVSAALIERIEAFADASLLGAHESVGDGVLFSLPGHPRDAGRDDVRAEQRRLLAGLGFEAVAERDRWTQGYWQRARRDDAG